ncbi:hypothetical protein ADL27_37305, partial [Streptomyces sp. NRRL F-6602]
SQGYGYDTGQGQYTGHADPYAATAGYDQGAQSGYGDWNGQQAQDAYGYPQETYSQTGYTDTPPGGVWVPQQRDGGNGYDEASGMPRLYREAPLNGIWEGSGNVQALDVLRAIGREPAAPRRGDGRIRLHGRRPLPGLAHRGT